LVEVVMDEEEKICFDCASYFPDSPNEATEYGICLLDEAFDPVVDDLLEGRMDEACRALVERKRFVGGRPACDSFEPAEMWEIDDDSPLGRELRRLAETGELNREALDQLLDLAKLDAVDWTAVPIDEHEARLESGTPEAREAALQTLSGLMSFGNQSARNALVRYLKGLPPPGTLEEVHFKVKVLRLMRREDTQEELVPHLVEELYRTPSNNTTRQWITAVFRFLEDAPPSLTRAPLERMLGDKRFSPRLKQKMKDILYRPRWEEDGP
jgi:hypothetical protein